MREIVLDTETTGFDPRSGDRMVEIGCIELENLTPTGRTFHTMINPDRNIGPEVVRVHGITNEKVKEAPKFPEIADALHAFIGDAPVIAHNAGFDRNFVNFELEAAGRAIIADDRWIDTLQLAQKRFPGMANSLDALCKRFKVSLVERTLHGALTSTGGDLDTPPARSSPAALDQLPVVECADEGGAHRDDSHPAHHEAADVRVLLAVLGQALPDVSLDDATSRPLQVGDEPVRVDELPAAGIGLGQVAVGLGAELQEQEPATT